MWANTIRSGQFTKSFLEIFVKEALPLGPSDSMQGIPLLISRKNKTQRGHDMHMLIQDSKKVVLEA